jgi:hypothetical protein
VIDLTVFRISVRVGKVQKSTKIQSPWPKILGSTRNSVCGFSKSLSSQSRQNPQIKSKTQLNLFAGLKRDFSKSPSSQNRQNNQNPCKNQSGILSVF